VVHDMSNHGGVLTARGAESDFLALLK
jgi:hypothetical protein